MAAIFHPPVDATEAGLLFWFAYHIAGVILVTSFLLWLVRLWLVRLWEDRQLRLWAEELLADWERDGVETLGVFLVYRGRVLIDRGIPCEWNDVHRVVPLRDGVLEVFGRQVDKGPDR